MDGKETARKIGADGTEQGQGRNRTGNGLLGAFMVPHPPMIVPQVGRGSERQVEATRRAYEKVAEEIAALQPETIVIASPHSVMYMDYFHVSPGRWADGSFAQFGASETAFHEEYDTELVMKLEQLAAESGLPAGTMGERDPALDHGTMVPLYFIRQKYRDGKILRIGLSGLPLTDHYAVGQKIAEAADQLQRRVVFVASGDLSHKLQDYGPYGFAPEGPKYDERIMDVCSRVAFGELFDFSEEFCENAAECGHRAFVMMAGALDGREVEAKQLSHEDITGVGYGICTFYPKGWSEERRFLDAYRNREAARLEDTFAGEDAYVQLARKTVESYVRDGRVPRLRSSDAASEDLPRSLVDQLKELPQLLKERAGAFVSIHEHGNLRGCIGTILPVQDCLAQEIIHNAVSAAVKDPRFLPIREEELPFLEINVDVLGAPEDIDSMDQLDVKRYGVIVSSGGRRGLLLPDLDGVDTVAQQVSIARQKAGIGPGEDIQLQRFEVVRHT